MKTNQGPYGQIVHLPRGTQAKTYDYRGTNYLNFDSDQFLIVTGYDNNDLSLLSSQGDLIYVDKSSAFTLK